MHMPQHTDATATASRRHNDSATTIYDSPRTPPRQHVHATATTEQLRDEVPPAPRRMSNWATTSLPHHNRNLQQRWTDDTATVNGRDSDRKLKLQWPRMDAKDKANGRHSDHNRTLEQPQADATATVKGRCSDRHQTPLSIATSSGRYSNSQRIDIRCISLVNLLTRDIGSSVNHAHCARLTATPMSNTDTICSTDATATANNFWDQSIKKN